MTDASTATAHGYRGTDIDGVSIDPDRLEIRGRSVTDMIGHMSFAAAALFVLADADSDAATLDGAMAGVLAGIGPDHAAARIAGLAASAGADLPRAVMAGLCAVGKPEVAGIEAALPGLPAGAGQGLAVCASVPALIAAWRKGRGLEGAAGAGGAGFVALARSICASDSGTPAPADLALFEDVLVGWMGGFGPLPPSVMIPRIAIGTGVSIEQAVAAGFAAAGPLHIGATMQAVALLDAALTGDGDGPPADARICAALDRMLASGQKIGGFGHPLLNEDPRPPRIRARATALGGDPRVWAVYDAACARMRAQTGLAPNVDFSCGAAMIAAGLRDPAAAAGLAMMARGVGITAHVLERKQRPAFGLRRQTAREHLNSFPTGWL